MKTTDMVKYAYDHPRPALTVDIVVVSGNHVLLIERLHDPYRGCWALPGGFVNEGESAPSSACRELQEETTLERTPDRLVLFGAFGDAGRDPRGWTVSIAFYAEADRHAEHVRGCDDARDAQWFDVDSLPPLAFDHEKIINLAIRRLRSV